MHLHIDLWIDITCPWCYLGKHRLDKALQQFDFPSQNISIDFHPFYVNPAQRADYTPPFRPIPVEFMDPNEEAAKKEKGARVKVELRDEGLPLAVSKSHPSSSTPKSSSPPDSTDSHLLLQHVSSLSTLPPSTPSTLLTHLLAAHFAHHVPITSRTELIRIAKECGVPEEEAKKAWRSEEARERLAAREKEAREEREVTGVPWYVFRFTSTQAGQPSDEPLIEFPIVGAQDTAVLIRMLNRGKDRAAKEAERRRAKL
ncbi:thioredoxin-like protein [Gonapodya prolifera JEL478]|uniref:Thioredoxin-like protein n=1 Tax=Gonapodya prolifera (strain JEL478) TaxID=1344416 RepID=A0A139AEA8_GONPJ|nr:thioredoxin-like protein [Gonapodya prolifera JEL478]|eukprot:KXS14775.1 thioredoxin-like protein [Gonapodya prolifera JEL478]